MEIRLKTGCGNLTDLDMKNKNNTQLRGKGIECCVSGALALMFRVSQASALAPVAFARRRHHRTVRVSRILSVVYRYFMSFINIIAFAGLFLDLTLPTGQSTLAPTFISKLAWISDLSLVMMTASMAVYGARARVQKLIQCLNMAQKVKKSLKRQRKTTCVWSKYKTSAVFIIFLSSSTSILVGTWIKYLYKILQIADSKTTLIPMVLYVAYDVSFVILIILELQFMVVVLEVYKVLKTLNNSLERIMYPSSLSVYSKPNPMKTTPEAVHQLTSSFAIICDVIRRLDHLFGSIVVMMVCSCALQLVITPYKLINALYTDSVEDLMLQWCWCLMHFLRLVIIIEPPHRTVVEMERTRLLVGRLTLHSSGLLYDRLAKFNKFLLHNTVAYTPMGICTLARSLFASMTGRAVTYLVIIIQFQEMGVQRVRNHYAE